MSEDHLEWRCVLSTGDPILLGLARSMLDTDHIKYVVEGEDLQDLVEPDGIDPEINPMSGPMEIWANGEQVDQAVALLKDLRMDAES